MDLDNNITLKHTVPMIRVVNAAIIDMHEDIGRCQETFSHWAARGFRKINGEVLRMGRRRVILPVNRNTRTATLPLDFHEEFTVAVIHGGRKIPLSLRSDLIDVDVREVDEEPRCPRCGTDKSLCNDLAITQTQDLIAVGDQIATKTTVKRLYPNGDYMLEVTFPVMNMNNSQIEYTTIKEMIMHLDMLPCGCPDLNDVSCKQIEVNCPDVFCKHLTPCDECCETDRDWGGYQIFEETGLITFSNRNITRIYLEYAGFLPKKNGQYHIPEVAFETLVEYTKYKFTWNKRNFTQWERRDQRQAYLTERENMEKQLYRFPLATIMRTITLLPKFDLTIPFDEYCCTSRVDVPRPRSANFCEPQQQTIPTAAMFGGGVDRVPWKTTGLENGVLTHEKLKGKRLLYFNLESNDSYEFLAAPSTPNEQQLVFDKVNGTITLMYPFDTGLRAYAIFAPDIS